jgi:glycosyltransferase involved in cell wall biosynthesis
MRILVLTHEYPPIGGGGGRVAEDLCVGLAARGHEMRVLTAHYRTLALEERRDGVIIQRLTSNRRLPYEAGFGTMARYVWRAVTEGRRLIDSWRPDVIHVHFAVPAGAAAYLLRRMTGTPYLLTAHLGDVPGGVPEKTDRWFRWVFPFTPAIWHSAARVVAVSQFTSQLASRHYHVPIQVIPNGVDLAAIKPSCMQPNQPPRLVFAGRFVEQKNPLYVVRALAQLRDQDWTCTMIGDGILRPTVEAEIRRLDLTDRFTLTGWITPQQVLGCYDRSDILFMPSFSEGLPVVGVQALAMGLALVVGNAGGFIELVDGHRNGSLIDPNNLESGVTALHTLLTDPAQLTACRQASRELAQRFDLTDIVSAYEKSLVEVSHG